MANTLPAFLDYFRALAGQHVALQDFVHGPASRILAGSRSSLRYPLLWLETPTLTLTDKDGTAPYGQRHSAFVVLASASLTDYVAQDAAWAQTEAIALDVLSHLRRDKQARRFGFTLDGTSLEAVQGPAGTAGEIGWRFEFSLGEFVPLPFEAARWQQEGGRAHENLGKRQLAALQRGRHQRHHLPGHGHGLRHGYEAD